MKHISGSQISKFITCAYQYYLAYVVGKRLPGSPATVAGSAFHAMAQQNNLNYISEGKNLSRHSLWEILQRELTTGFNKNLRLTKAEQVEGLDALKLRYGAKLKECLPVFLEKQQNLKIVGSEVAKTMSIPYKLGDVKKEYELQGIIDVVTEEGILDYKFGKSPKSQQDIDNDLSLTLYALIYSKVYNKLPTKILYHNYIHTPANPPRPPKKDILYRSGSIAFLELETTRTQEDIQILYQHIYCLMQALESGIFPPCSYKNFLCREDYCGYYGIDCKFRRKNA